MNEGDRVPAGRPKYSRWEGAPAGLILEPNFTCNGILSSFAGLRIKTPEAVAIWVAPRRTTRGGQPRYSDLAIETALSPGMVFGLRLRQAEGFLESVLQLMGLALSVPDHTTLSRRTRTWQSPSKRQHPQVPLGGRVHVLVDSTGLQIYGAGQWLKEKHGAPNPVAVGANCIWRWMPIAARSSPTQ